MSGAEKRFPAGSAVLGAALGMGLLLGYAWELDRGLSTGDEGGGWSVGAGSGSPLVSVGQGGSEAFYAASDLLQELERRGPLTAEECLDALDAWFARPGALGQQLALYDAVMRLEKEGFSAVADGIEGRDGTFQREVRPIVMDRWLREDPQAVWRRERIRLEEREPIGVSWPRLAVALAGEDGASALDLANLAETSYPRISAQVYKALAEYWTETGGDDWLARIEGKVELAASGQAAAEPSLEATREAARKAEAEGEWGKLELALAQLGERDIWSALHLADQIGDPEQRNRVRARLLRLMAPVNPAGVLQRALEMERATRMKHQRQLQTAVAEAIERDDGAVLEWFLQQGDEATLALIDLLDGRQGRRELPLLMAMPESSRRNQLLRHALNVYGSDNYTEAEQWIRDNLDESTLVEFRLNALPNRIGQDLEGAKKFADSLEHPQQRFLAASTVATHLAATDLDEALRWTMEETDAETRDAVLIQLSYRWMQERPEELIQYAADLEDGRLKQNLQQRVVKRREDTSTGRELLRFAAGLGDRRLARRVAAGAIRDLGLNDPQEAIRELDRWISKEPDRAWDVAAQFASQWSASDPMGAAEALFPRGGEVARGALPTVMGSWISTSPETSLQAVEHLPSSELRREALQVVLQRHEVRQHYPEVAAQAEALLGALSDED